MRCKRTCLLFALLWSSIGLIPAYAQYFRILTPDTVALYDFFSWQPGKWPVVSAHRGGSFPGRPENCLETFDFLLRNTHAVIEFDIAMTRDSVLVLMHDDRIDRTTTGKGAVTSLTWDELSRFRLVDYTGDVTPYRVTLLTEALAWARGKTVLMLDVKRSVSFTKVVEAVRAADALAFCVIIVYSLEDAILVHSLEPSLMVSVNIQDKKALEQFRISTFPPNRAVAFTGVRLAEAELFQGLQNLGICSILGSMGNLDARARARGMDRIFGELFESGPDIISTDIPVELGKLIRRRYPLPEQERKFFDYPPR